jgi:small neutral amino acid transporter SnatA (MarC family)
MVILFSERYAIPLVCAAVLIASAASAALLGVSPVVFRYLGRRGASALERLMGMILVMISVQMVLNGIDAYLASRR